MPSIKSRQLAYLKHQKLLINISYLWKYQYPQGVSWDHNFPQETYVHSHVYMHARLS